MMIRNPKINIQTSKNGCEHYVVTGDTEKFEIQKVLFKSADVYEVKKYLKENDLLISCPSGDDFYAGFKKNVFNDGKCELSFFIDVYDDYALEMDEYMESLEFIRIDSECTNYTYSLGYQAEFSGVKEMEKAIENLKSVLNVIVETTQEICDDGDIKNTIAGFKIFGEPIDNYEYKIIPIKLKNCMLENAWNMVKKHFPGGELHFISQNEFLKLV